MKRTWYLVISFVLTAVIGLILYRSVPDWREAGSVMVSGKPQWFLAGLGFVAIHMILRSVRWGVLLAPTKEKISLRNLFSLTLVKYVVNVIPPRVGEIAGSVLLARKENIPATSVIAASLCERILDLLAVLLVFGFETIRYSAIVGLAATILVLAGLIGILRSRRWHDRIPKIIRKHLLSFLDGLRALQSRSAAGKTLLLSLLIWLAISAQLWCLIRAYLGTFPITGTFLIVAVTVVGVAIPTPGGVGGFQFFMTLSLINFFRPYLSDAHASSQAAGISNGAYIVSMVPVIVVGLILLHHEGLSFGRAAKLSLEQESKNRF